MRKEKIRVFGHDYYLLGADSHGTRYYLQEASFDCDWYWGFGYVETFDNNIKPWLSRDIDSHQHFWTMFLDEFSGVDHFESFFPHCPLSEDEIWKLMELMQSFYTAREYACFVHLGGAHITSNPARGLIMDGEDERRRINEIVIPAITSEVYAILGGEENNE